MIRDEGRFLIAEAQILEQLRHVEHIVVDSEALVHELLEQRRTPAGTTAPSFDRPIINETGEFGLLGRGAFGWAPWGLLARCTLEAVATEYADPCGNGLLVHA